MQSTSRSPSKVAAVPGVFAHSRLVKLLRLVFDTAALRGGARCAPYLRRATKKVASNPDFD